LATTLAKTFNQKSDDLYRIASIVGALERPLENYPDLLAYARGMAKYAQGDIESAQKEFDQINKSRELNGLLEKGISLPQSIQRFEIKEQKKNRLNWPVSTQLLASLVIGLLSSSVVLAFIDRSPAKPELSELVRMEKLDFSLSPAYLQSFTYSKQEPVSDFNHEEDAEVEQSPLMEPLHDSNQSSISTTSSEPKLTIYPNLSAISETSLPPVENSDVSDSKSEFEVHVADGEVSVIPQETQNYEQNSNGNALLPMSDTDEEDVLLGPREESQRINLGQQQDLIGEFPRNAQSGPVGSEVTGSATSGASISEGESNDLSNVISRSSFNDIRRGTLISFATAPGQLASDGEGRNSPYTTSLLLHLAEPDLDIFELMRRVRADVFSSTEGFQIPWFTEYLTEEGELILNPSEQESEEQIPRKALVIGNSAYPSYPLKNPVNDANDIAQSLLQLGFDVVLVTDSDNYTLNSAIRNFVRNLSQGDIGLFYFAGYGVEVEGEDYMVPIDAELTAEADVFIDAISIDDVVSLMDSSDSRTNLIFIDANRDNPFYRRWRRPQ
jgi:hypothetical protein